MKFYMRKIGFKKVDDSRRCAEKHASAALCVICHRKGAENEGS